MEYPDCPKRTKQRVRQKALREERKRGEQQPVVPKPGYTRNGVKIGRPVRFSDPYHVKARERAAEIRAGDRMPARSTLAEARDPKPEPPPEPRFETAFDRFCFEHNI